ncbi:MAG: hypothetical protein ACFB0C_02840 [Leptolyngbyaceae cyanobacterium]
MSDSLPPAQRMKLIKLVSELSPAEFGQLLFSLNPPAGVVSPHGSPQGIRANELLSWSESPTGCGLATFLEMLSVLVPGQFDADSWMLEIQRAILFQKKSKADDISERHLNVNKDKRARTHKSKNELIRLKKKALDTEAAGQLLQAKKLWKDILNLYPSEHESYIKAIERIAERTASSDFDLSPLKLHKNQNFEDSKNTSPGLILDKKSSIPSELYLRESLSSESFLVDFEHIVLDPKGQNINRGKGVARQKSEFVGSSEIPMIEIPGGDFTMGSLVVQKTFQHLSQSHHENLITLLNSMRCSKASRFR